MSDSRKFYKLVEQYIEVDGKIHSGFIGELEITPNDYAKLCLLQDDLKGKITTLLREQKYE